MKILFFIIIISFYSTISFSQKITLFNAKGIVKETYLWENNTERNNKIGKFTEVKLNDFVINIIYTEKPTSFFLQLNDENGVPFEIDFILQELTSTRVKINNLNYISNITANKTKLKLIHFFL